MNYKVIESNLISIYEDEKNERLVNARELHRAMKVGRDFTNWIKDRIKKYDFVQNEDYILTLAKIGERQNVIITISMVKEITIVENTEFFKRNNFVTLGNLKRLQIDKININEHLKQLNIVAKIKNKEYNK